MKHTRSTLAFSRIRLRPTTGCPEAPSRYAFGSLVCAGGSRPAAICLSRGSCGSLSVATAGGLLLL